MFANVPKIELVYANVPKMGTFANKCTQMFHFFGQVLGTFAAPYCTGISEIPLFDPILLKMDCHLFEVTTVLENFVLHEKQKL